MPKQCGAAAPPPPPRLWGETAGFWPSALSRLVFQVFGCAGVQVPSCTDPAPFARCLWVNSCLEIALRPLRSSATAPDGRGKGQRSPNATEPGGAALCLGSATRRGKGLSAAGFGGWVFQRASDEAAELAGGRCERPRARRVREGFGCSRARGSHPEPQVVGLPFPGRSTLPGVPGAPHSSSRCAHIWGVSVGFCSFAYLWWFIWCPE